jgi:tetratricopeptide (TPR) repeat protein
MIMCVFQNTPAYEKCVRELAAFSREIGRGAAPAITWLYRGGCLQNLRDLAGAVRDYDVAVARGAELTPTELAQVYDSRSISRRQLKDFAGAVADGEQAVTLIPDNARYWANLGDARYWAQDYDGAITALNRALSLNPEETWAYAYRGRCRQRRGEHEPAIADLTLALSDKFSSYHLLLDRAESFFWLGRYAEAIADCAEAEQRAGSEENYRINLIRGCASLLSGDPDRALGDLAHALVINKSAPELYLWRGLAFRALGDETAAAADLAIFAARHPGGAARAAREMADALELVSAPAASPRSPILPVMAAVA